MAEEPVYEGYSKDDPEEDEPEAEKPVCFSPVAPAVWKSADHASHLLWLDIVREEDGFPCHEIYSVRLDSARTADREPKFFAAAVLPGDKVLYYLRLENPAVNGAALRYPCYFITEDRTYPIPIEDEEVVDVPVLYPFKLIKTFQVHWDESSGIVQLIYWTNEKIVSYDPGVPEWDLCDPEPSDGIEPFADQRVKDSDSEDIPVVVEPLNLDECDPESVQRVLYYAEGRPYLVETDIEGRPEQEQIVIFNRPVLVTYPGQFNKDDDLPEQVMDAHICCTCCPPTPESMQPGQSQNAVVEDYEEFVPPESGKVRDPVTGALYDKQKKVIVRLGDQYGFPARYPPNYHDPSKAGQLMPTLSVYNDPEGSQVKDQQRKDAATPTEAPKGVMPNAALAKGQSVTVVTDTNGHPKISAEPKGAYEVAVNTGTGYTTPESRVYVTSDRVDPVTGKITPGPTVGPVHAPYFTGDAEKLIAPYVREVARTGSSGTPGVLAYANDGNAAILVSAAPYSTNEIGLQKTPSGTLRTDITRDCYGEADNTKEGEFGYKVGQYVNGLTPGNTYYSFYETILFFDTSKLDMVALGTVLGYEILGKVKTVNVSGDLDPNRITLYDENYDYAAANIPYPHIDSALSRTPGQELFTVGINDFVGKEGTWYSFKTVGDYPKTGEYAKTKIPRNGIAIFSLRPVSNATANSVSGVITMTAVGSGTMRGDRSWPSEGDPGCPEYPDDISPGSIGPPSGNYASANWCWDNDHSGNTSEQRTFGVYNTKGICPSGNLEFRLYVDSANLDYDIPPGACETVPFEVHILTYPDYPDDDTLPVDPCWDGGDGVMFDEIGDFVHIPRVFTESLSESYITNEPEHNICFRVRTDCGCADPGFEGDAECGEVDLGPDWTKSELRIPSDEMETYTFRDKEIDNYVEFSDFKIRLFTTNSPSGTEVPVDGVRYISPVTGEEIRPPDLDGGRLFFSWPDMPALKAGEELFAFDLVKIDGDTAVRAIALNNMPDMDLGSIAMVESNVVAGAPVVLRTIGRVDNTNWSFSAGQPLFLDTTAGQLTNDPPAALSRPVAFVLPEGQSIYFNPGTEAFIHVRKNSGDIIGSGRLLNLIEGPGVKITVVRDSTNREIDITFEQSGFGTHTHNVNQTVTPSPDSLTSGFTVSGGLYTPSSLEVYVNGLHQVAGSGFDFIETVPGSGQFEFQPWAIPDSGEVIRVSYLT